MKLTIMAVLALVACVASPSVASAENCLTAKYAYAGPSEEYLEHKTRQCLEEARKQIRNGITAHSLLQKVPALNDVNKAIQSMDTFISQFALKKAQLKEYFSPEGILPPHRNEAAEAIQAEAAELKRHYEIARTAYERAVRAATPDVARQFAIMVIERERKIAEAAKQAAIDLKIHEQLDEMVGNLP